MNLRQMAEKRADAKIKFQENLYKYLIVNTIISIICLAFMHSFWILALTLIFWGFDVLDDFFKAYPISNHRENIIRKELSKMGD